MFPLILAVRTLLAAGVIALAGGPVAPEDVSDAYRGHFESRDEGALAQLWLDHPGRILVTIDADLEGSLSAWEAAPDAGDTAAIAKLHQRALWGARVATDITGRAIFLDYTAAFVGWSPEQRRSFRGGQAAYGRARRALREGDAAAALEAARECRDLAEPLGDWWGAAMGLSAEGEALMATGRAADGLVPMSRARLLYDQLGLTGSEYGCLQSMAQMLITLERWPRAHATLTDALATATDLGDDAGATALAALAEQVAAHLPPNG